MLKRRGYNCAGCAMKSYEHADIGADCRRTCCSLEDMEDARAAVFCLGIPVFNFKDVLRGAVMEKFAAGYSTL